MEQDNFRHLQNRFSELAARAEGQGRYTYTPFLTLAEQDLLCRMTGRLAAPFRWQGGYEGAERRLACFGREEDMGYPPPCPIACLSMAPAAPRFAGQLGHRDYLGALMGLGIRRELLGDIQLSGGGAWLFCLEEIAPFIAENLTQAGKTILRCAPSRPPEALSRPPEPTALVVASPRLDGLIAGVWRLSRGESQQLIEKKLVFLDGRQEESPSRAVPEGAMVSVRGMGRFRYEGEEAQTRKGRLRVRVRIY